MCPSRENGLSSLQPARVSPRRVLMGLVPSLPGVSLRFLGRSRSWVQQCRRGPRDARAMGAGAQSFGVPRCFFAAGLPLVGAGPGHNPVQGLGFPQMCIGLAYTTARLGMIISHTHAYFSNIMYHSMLHAGGGGAPTSAPYRAPQKRSASTPCEYWRGAAGAAGTHLSLSVPSPSTAARAVRIAPLASG